jgi:hypothetical protein
LGEYYVRSIRASLYFFVVSVQSVMVMFLYWQYVSPCCFDMTIILLLIIKIVNKIVSPVTQLAVWLSHSPTLFSHLCLWCNRICVSVCVCVCVCVCLCKITWWKNVNTTFIIYFQHYESDRFYWKQNPIKQCSNEKFSLIKKKKIAQAPS